MHPQNPLKLNIIGTGKGLPSQRVTSAQIDAELGLKAGRTKKLGGLAQRWFLAEGESADAMQLQAVQAALVSAGIGIDEVN